MNKGVFRVKKMIKIVRNPLDAIVSQCNGMWTYTHSLSPVERLDKAVPKEFDETLKLFGEGMAEEFEETIKAETSMANRIPSFVCRYEDLVQKDPVPLLKNLFKFLLDVKSIEGTVVEKRIEESCGNKAPKALYSAKPGGYGINRNASMFNEQQM